jgi:hypothetical protein
VLERSCGVVLWFVLVLVLPVDGIHACGRRNSIHGFPFHLRTAFLSLKPRIVESPVSEVRGRKK